MIPIAERANFTGTISIHCGVALDEDDVSAIRDHLRNNGGYLLGKLNKHIEIEDRYNYQDSRFENRTSTWTDLQGSGHTRAARIERPLTYHTDRTRWYLLASFIRSRLPLIWFFPNFLFDFPDKIYIEPSADESPVNRFYRALIQDILDALSRDLDLDKHVIQRYRSNTSSDRQNLQQVLLELGRHVTRTVVAAWNNMFSEKPISDKRVSIVIDADPPGAGAGQDAVGRLWVRFLLEEADGWFAVHERSLGFRWFFVYLLITSYRGRRRSTSQDMLFLFDEPASNLHPTAQAALLTSLAELSQQTAIVYTTHSHHLINPDWLGTTYVVTNRGLDAGAVSIDFSARRTDIQVMPYRQFAAHHPEQSHFFQPILDVLD